MTRAPATGALIGRAQALVRVTSLLAESRLVTLMGAGGVGKTRLALEVALSLAQTFPGGVFVCELSPLSQPDEVAGAVGAAFGPGAEHLPQFVAQQLGERPGLLLLDNCEHVLDGTRTVVESLLAGSPSLTILATSRERLRLPGELPWTLGGLAADDAAELLIVRARRHDASFTVTDANRGAVMEICERLDGIPLAIELAAARLAILPATAIAAMLDDALSLLSSDEMSPRQRTLRATLDWSCNLLSPKDQRALNRLSMFSGWFDIRAAATLLDVDEVGAVDEVAALRDRSLLVTDTEHDRPRFRLLEPVRQYAKERLERTGDAHQARRRHSEYVLYEAESLAPILIGVPGGQLAGIARFRGLLPDLRRAFAWALAHEPSWVTRIASATAWAWDIAGDLAEGERVLLDSLEADLDPRTATRILSGLALITDRLRGGGLSFAERAVAAGRAGGDRRDLGYALFLLGFGLRYAGRDDEADAAYDESTAIAAECGDQLLRAWSETIRTLVPITEGGRTWDSHGGEAAIRRARLAHERGLKVALEFGDVHSASIATGNLATICFDLGDIPAARKHLGECLDLFAMHGNWTVGTRMLHIAATIAARSKRYREAVILAGAFRRISDLAGRREGADHPDVAQARAVVGPGLAAQLMAQGASLSIEEMFDLARVETTLDDAPAILTPRELEVARLVAAGLASKEIARRLNRSERTVDNHVQNALHKLGFRSRSQLGSWLARQGC